MNLMDHFTTDSFILWNISNPFKHQLKYDTVIKIRNMGFKAIHQREMLNGPYSSATITGRRELQSFVSRINEVIQSIYDNRMKHNRLVWNYFPCCSVLMFMNLLLSCKPLGQFGIQRMHHILTILLKQPTISL